MASGTTPFFTVVHIIISVIVEQRKYQKKEATNQNSRCHGTDIRNGLVAKKVMQKKNYNFLRNIALEAYYREVDRDKAPKINGKRIWFTPRVKPERDEAISASTKYARL